MRTWLAALAISVAALTTAGVLGVAGADPVAPAGKRSITVNGAGTKTLPADASDADRDAAYDAALRSALAQAQARAQLIAQTEDPFPCGGVVPYGKPERGSGAGTSTGAPAQPRIATDAPPAPQECRQYASVSVTYIVG